MPRSVSVVSRSRLIAAAAVYALFCLAAAPAEAGCSKSVIMYNASWCPYCGQVRAILARNHIRYAVLDATTPKVQAIMLKRFGDTAVPRTLIGGVLIEGVDESRIKQLCR
jgi:glutaredoxin